MAIGLVEAVWRDVPADEALPEAVQQHVRDGQIAAEAMKYLVKFELGYSLINLLQVPRSS